MTTHQEAAMRGPRPGDAPEGATWDDGRTDEQGRDLDEMRRAARDFRTGMETAIARAEAAEVERDALRAQVAAVEALARSLDRRARTPRGFHPDAAAELIRAALATTGECK